MPLIKGSHIDLIIDYMENEFTTDTFIEAFRKEYPEDWELLVEMYGPGGRGTGNFYSPNVYIAQRLSKKLDFEYIEAPPEWGNREIALWYKETE